MNDDLEETILCGFNSPAIVEQSVQTFNQSTFLLNDEEIRDCPRAADSKLIPEPEPEIPLPMDDDLANDQVEKNSNPSESSLEMHTEMSNFPLDFDDENVTTVEIHSSTKKVSEEVVPDKGL